MVKDTAPYAFNYFVKEDVWTYCFNTRCLNDYILMANQAFKTIFCEPKTGLDSLVSSLGKVLMSSAEVTLEQLSSFGFLSPGRTAHLQNNDLTMESALQTVIEAVLMSTGIGSKSNIYVMVLRTLKDKEFFPITEVCDNQRFCFFKIY